MKPECVYCEPLIQNPPSVSGVVGFGSFTRKCDGKRLKRYCCNNCQRTFSEATFNPCYRQKKRDLNPEIFKSYVSGVSLRRMARLLRVNRKTIIRKFLFLALYASELFKLENKNQPKATTVEFDDLETFEHTKCKPLSVSIAVEYKTRRILGFRVARMPAKGHLAAISRKKYGPRADERTLARQSLFMELQDLVAQGALIKSDMNPAYVPDVKNFFPHSRHQVFKGRRGCVTGQGELKAGGFDPIFSINHTFAMARANMNRLFRRTWNTTKLPEMLSCHFALYALYHNLELIRSFK